MLGATVSARHSRSAAPGLGSTQRLTARPPSYVSAWVWVRSAIRAQRSVASWRRCIASTAFLAFTSEAPVSLR